MNDVNAKKKKILLISPQWVDLHLDIQTGLLQCGYEVEFFPEYSFASDPYKISSKHPVNQEKAEELKTTYWRNLLNKTATVFDCLLVIDGQGVNAWLFEELKRRNPDIYCVCYLYDTTYSVYHFERNFLFFDRVFSFDRKDAKAFKLDFLPIYWVPADVDPALPRYRIFGFGAYSETRLQLYRQLAEIATQRGLCHFIKVYHKKIVHEWWYRAYCLLRKLLRMHSVISLADYHSDLVSQELIFPKVFRQMIKNSDVILDTKVLQQDGLTARFMWALGEGKKIITTNPSVCEYEFYSPEQILIVNDGEFDGETRQKIVNFIECRNVVPERTTALTLQYRLDYWLKKILGPGGDETV